MFISHSGTFFGFSKSEPKSVAWFIFHSKPYLSNYIGMVCMDFSQSKTNSLMVQCVNKSRCLWSFVRTRKGQFAYTCYSQSSQETWMVSAVTQLAHCSSLYGPSEIPTMHFVPAFSCPNYLKSQRIGTRCYYMNDACLEGVVSGKIGSGAKIWWV